MLWEECLLSITLQLESKRKLNVPFFVTKKNCFSKFVFLLMLHNSMSLPFACSSAQPRDGIDMPNWTMPELLQPFVCWLKEHCPEPGMHGESWKESALEDYQKSASRYRHVWDFASGYFCRKRRCLLPCPVYMSCETQANKLAKGLSRYPGEYWRTSKALKYKYLTYCFRDNFPHIGLLSQKG